MTIQGSVYQIVFFNEQNNYTVVEMDCSGELITAVGIFPSIQEGELLELEGEMVNNPRFGEQLKVSNVSFKTPTTKEDIITYLSSGLIKGIGKNKAKTIVDMFGEDTLEIIEFEPEKLQQIRGIGKKTAKQISDSYTDNRSMKDTIMYLQHFDVTTNLAIKIYKAYHSSTRQVLEQNPYKLIDDIEGVGFKIADRIASSMGIEFDSLLRIRAGIVYVISERCNQSGNTCVPKNELIQSASETLNIPDTIKICDVLEKMIITGEVKETTVNDIILIAKPLFYYSELGIADTLNRLSNSAIDITVRPNAEIYEYEFINKITLHESQKQAIINAVTKGVEIITGGPGTGKTTIIKAIISILKSMGRNFALTAPTGRASKRLQDATGTKSQTIHRLLMVSNDSKGGFKYNEYNKLPYDTIIIDEISMVDVVLFNSLLKALQDGTRLIIVGDKDQLPSVSPGNVLKDIIESGKFSVDYLTHIYRQSEDSLIITNAHKINRGELPVITNKAKDFFFEEHLSSQENLDTILDLCSRRLPNFLHIDPKEIQVLAPIKKTIDGVNNINKELQNIINPKTLNKKELVYNGVTFREGDKVMHTINNYDLGWTTEEGEGKGVFNGDMGEIVEVDSKNRLITVLFEDDRVAIYTEGEFNELTLSYAISIHKSQGSEFDTLIICISNASYKMQNRNLLYTAVTRAKKMVVIIGNKKHLYHMVKNDEIATRYSLLRYFLEDKINENA